MQKHKSCAKRPSTLVAAKKVSQEMEQFAKKLTSAHIVVRMTATHKQHAQISRARTTVPVKRVLLEKGKNALM